MSHGPCARILGHSPAMQRVEDTLLRAASSSATVLIRGETGSGKELVARAIHEASPRAPQAFVKIDCAALPENLLESELFGYERGAFTGASARKLGRVESADRGTLFLDEVGELSPALQAKLLRLLQDRQFERLGGTRPIDVDVRVLVAIRFDLSAGSTSFRAGAEKEALARCAGNRSSAARMLGVSRSTLYAKLRDHQLVADE